MIATTDVSAFRLGHAAAYAGPAAGADAKSTKMRHLCKNMQKVVQDTASRLLSAIGIGGPSMSVATPVPESSSTRLYITHHQFIPAPAIEPGFAIKAVDSQGRIHPDVVVMHHGMHKMRKGDHPDAPFLQRVNHALMSLGPWEGRIVAFVLGGFFLFCRSI